MCVFKIVWVEGKREISRKLVFICGKWSQKKASAGLQKSDGS